MKKFRLLALALSAVLCFSLFVGCDNRGTGGDGGDDGTTPTADILDVRSRSGWIDANSLDMSAENNYAGLFAYKTKGQEMLSNLSSAISVSKFNAYDAFYYGLGSVDLTGYKKLVVTAQSSGAVTTVGDGDEATEQTVPTKLLFKIETAPPIEGGEGKSEVTVELSEQPKTFEFDLTYDDYDAALAGATRLTFIAGPGSAFYDTEITFTEVYFSKEDPNPELVVNQAGTVSFPLIYDGVSDTFNVNSGFATNDGNVTPMLNGTETVITVPTNKGEWEYVSTKISGNLKSFTQLKVVFTAPEGVTFKLKFEGGGAAQETTTEDELAHAGKGAEQTEWIWNSFTADALTAGPEMRLLIFPTPGGAVESEYTIVIHELVFMK